MSRRRLYAYDLRDREFINADLLRGLTNCIIKVKKKQLEEISDKKTFEGAILERKIKIKVMR